MPDDDTREEIHEPAGEDGAASAVGDPVGDEVAAAVLARFPGTVFHDSHGQPVVYVDRTSWLELARLLRDEERFTQCVDVTAVDHLVDAARTLPAGVSGERFEVVANFLSHPRNRRIRAITQVPEDDAEIASIVEVYPGVNFAEREVLDLYGITFTDHPDPTRILMPDDWVGHPLRKDDPNARVPVTFKEDPVPR